MNMGKRILPETNDEILRMLRERCPIIEIARRCNVSRGYVWKLKREYENEMRQLIEEQKEKGSPLREYREFSFYENLRRQIGDAFNDLNFQAYTHTVSELERNDEKVEVGLDMGGKEVYIGYEDIHRLLSHGYVSKARAGVLDLFDKKKQKVLDLIANAEPEQASEIVNEYLAEIRREALALPLIDFLPILIEWFQRFGISLEAFSHILEACMDAMEKTLRKHPELTEKVRRR